ncbi:MAG: Stp1/IreP family PP2C-type Ser/Thr phosphatase [bacterium]
MKKEEKKIKITTAVYSDVGTVRKANEDSFYISQDENLIIVCDGMGGQVAGGLASRIAVETINDIFHSLKDEPLNKLLFDIKENLEFTTRRLIASVRVANRRLFNMAIKFPRLRGMGTTVVALALDKNFASMVHVGDSRILRISDEKINQLTEDHSWLNELVEDNEIDEDEIETFAQRNVITRALGTGPSIKIDIHCEKYKKDDIYILCTDGLHTAVESEEIKSLYQKYHGELNKLIQKLIEKAKIRDGSDNITVAIAKLKENSKKTPDVGISTTIAEEDEKILSFEDKILQERYGDQKLKMSKKERNPMVNRRNILMAVLALSAAIMVGFFLGFITKPDKLKSNSRRSSLITINKKYSAKESKAARNQATTMTANKMTENTNESKPNTTAPQRIQHSKVSNDAVLATVFFNNLNDYNSSLLEKNGLVLDKFHPYDDGIKAIEGNFTIFFIDTSNNVIHQTSVLQIPKVSEE